MGFFSTFAGFHLANFSHPDIDPLFSGLAYFISIPLFIASTALLLRNIHMGRPVTIPAMLSLVFLAGSYIYLSSVNTILPAWVYLAAAIAVAVPTGFALLFFRNTGKIPRQKLKRLRNRS